MPIYEYLCLRCGNRFERLVRSFNQTVSCPSCQSATVEKQLSPFATATRGDAPPSGPASGGGCGGGSCGCAH